jgi:hypothetical protein
MARWYSSRSPTDTLRAPDYCHQVASGSQAARCSGVHCCCDCCAVAGEVANVGARASSAAALGSGRRFSRAARILILEPSALAFCAGIYRQFSSHGNSNSSTTSITLEQAR